MKRSTLISYLFLFSSLLAQAQDKSRIIALENSWNQAELHNDAHAVDLLIADDFVMPSITKNPSAFQKKKPKIRPNIVSKRYATGDTK